MKFRGSIPIGLTLMLAGVDGRMLVAQSPPIAYLIEVKGTVELKREGSSDYEVMTRDGKPLYFGDLLLVQKGAKAVIQYTSNSATWPVPDDGVPRGVANTCSPPS